MAENAKLSKIALVAQWDHLRQGYVHRKLISQKNKEQKR